MVMRNSPLLELDDLLVDRQRRALHWAWTVFTLPSRSAREDVFHLHRLDHGPGLAGLHLLPRR